MFNPTRSDLPPHLLRLRCCHVAVARLPAVPLPAAAEAAAAACAAAAAAAAAATSTAAGPSRAVPAARRTRRRARVCQRGSSAPRPPPTDQHT
eukprot:5257922-Prymnesium_polylepis.1